MSIVKPVRFIAFAIFCALLLSIDLPAKAQSSVNGMADTPWPMYQHDPQHTGRSPFLGPVHQPELLWSAQLPNPSGENGGISIAVDGNLLISMGGWMINFNPVTRQIDWVVYGSNSRSAALVAADNSLYRGDGPAFSQISPAGEVVWKALLDQNYSFGSSPTFGVDGNLYFVHDGLWSFTPDGDYRWDSPYGIVGSHASPAIGLNGTVYAGGISMDLCAYLPDGSDISWCLDVDSSSDDKTPAIASDGTIYYPTSDGYLYAIKPSGDIKWKFTPDEELNNGEGVSNGIAIASDDSIRFALHPSDTHTCLYAIDSNGGFKWKVDLPANPLTGYYPGIYYPVVVDRAGNSLVCPANAACYGIGTDGSTLWEKEFPQVDSIDLEPASAPIIAADGLIYALDTEGHLYAYADPALYPALSSTTGNLGFKVEPGSESFTTTLPITSTLMPITYTATITPEVAWLSLPESGSVTPASLSLQFDPQTVSQGIYRTTLVVMPISHPGAWLEIPVTLNVGTQQAFLPDIVKGYNTSNRILYASRWFNQNQLASIATTGMDRRVISHDIFDLSTTISYAPDGKKAALGHYLMNRYIISILDISSGSFIMDIFDMGDNIYPSWAPDSSRLAYFLKQDDDGYGDIYRINLDGMEQTLLAANQKVTSLFWSPRGDKIAFNANYYDSFLMNSDGSGLYQIDTENFKDQVINWSPDGRSLILGSFQDSTNDPYQYGIYDIETGAYTILAYPYDQPGELRLDEISWLDASPSVVWSPDGKQIAYLGWGDQFDIDVYVINPDGSGQKNLTHDLDRNDAQIAWSPDSRWIAFTSQDNEFSDDPNYDIYIMRADGTQIRVLTTNILKDEKPFWLP